MLSLNTVVLKLRCHNAPAWNPWALQISVSWRQGKQQHNPQDYITPGQRGLFFDKPYLLPADWSRTSCSLEMYSSTCCLQFDVIMGAHLPSPSPECCVCIALKVTCHSQDLPFLALCKMWKSAIADQGSHHRSLWVKQGMNKVNK